MSNASSSRSAGNASPESVVSFVRDLLGRPDPDNPQPPGPWDPIIRAALERMIRFGPLPDPWHTMGPHPDPWHFRAGPVPDPWQVAFGPHPEPWHLGFGPSPQPWSPAMLFQVIARRHPELWDLFGGNPLSRVGLNPQPLPPKMVFAAALADELIGRAGAAQELADWLPSQGEERGIIIVGGRVQQFIDDICGNDIKFRFPRPGPRPWWWREELEGADLVAMGVRFEVAAGANDVLGATFSQAGEKLIQAGLGRMRG
jgi:hypothetical protein